MIWFTSCIGKRTRTLFLAGLLLSMFTACSPRFVDKHTSGDADSAPNPPLSTTALQTNTPLPQMTVSPSVQDQDQDDRDRDQPQLDGQSAEHETDSAEHEADHEEDEASEGRPIPWDDGHPAPPNGLSNAIAHVHTMQQTGSVDLAGAGVDSQHWEWIGPPTIGGRIYAIAIHPTTPTTMWVSSPAGGIWKTTNGGASWHALNDFMASLTISGLVLDPTNPDTLYASTGGLFELGAGVFRSTDGGTSWQQLTNTQPSTTQPQWAYMTRLTIAPDGRTLLASTSVGGSDNRSNGVWRSMDAGASWTQVLHGNGVIQVAFHPKDGRFAFASAFGKAWYSIDAGVTWNASIGLPTSPTALQDFDLRAELAAASDPRIVYASVAKGSGQLWKSSDGGRTYALVNSSAPYVRYGDQAGLWVDPTNPNIVIVGGVDAWRSMDGGVTLTRITSYKQVHADERAIVSDVGFNGTSNRTVYFGTDGGLYKTTDVYTATPDTQWTQLNTNLGVTQFFNGCGSAAVQVIAGGTVDNGTLRFDAATGWTQPGGGDGGACAMNQDNPDPLYGQFQHMGIWRRTSGATDVDMINGSYTYWNGSQWVTTWKAVPYQIPDAVPDAKGNVPNADFTVPLVLDPQNPNRLLTGGLSLWQTKDATTLTTSSTGPAWKSIKAPLPSTGDSNNYWRFISAISVAPSNPDIIWVGHTNGSIYKTVNGTSAAPIWERVGTDSIPAYHEISQLLIDPTDPNSVYVTIERYNGNHLWHTDDGGDTWTSLTGEGSTSLPDAPLYTIAVSPKNNQWLYVGSEVGIFTSQDGGSTWFVPQDGPANVAVHQLIWLGQTLVAVTNGRGVYKTVPTDQPASPTASPTASPVPPILYYLPLITK